MENFIVSARTRDVFERRQRLLLLVAEKIEALGLENDADEGSPISRVCATSC
jgi:hypothetical protein